MSRSAHLMLAAFSNHNPHTIWLCAVGEVEHDCNRFHEGPFHGASSCNL